MAERNYEIAVIGGDGIGPEVVRAGQEVLTALALADGGFGLSFTGYDWGSNYYRQHGLMMPADGLSQLENFDAIYFGSVGDPTLPDDITLWGLRLAICQGFDQYANVRPASCLVLRARCARTLPARSIGSSCGRIARANMLVLAAALTGLCRSKSRWMSLSLLEPA